jgi:hypothetical protein
LISLAAQFLEREEREAVEGDLIEGGGSAFRGLLDVTGLIIRRQAILWKNWRPWLAAFGLALPSTLLLMGLSVSVSRAYRELIDPAILQATGVTVSPGFWLLVCNVALLVAWSWTGGFVVGSISRRTVWVSAALSSLPCMFCLARFRIESLSRFCLLLFLLPAIWGVRRGLRIARIKLGPAIALAITVTALTIPTWSSSGAWIPNWALSWPAWFLVATAERHGWPLGRARNGP